MKTRSAVATASVCVAGSVKGTEFEPWWPAATSEIRGFRSTRDLLGLVVRLLVNARRWSRSLTVPVCAVWCLVCSVTQASVVTSFDIDLSPDTQNFAAANAVSLVLNYTINESGAISLGAVALTSGGDAASPARYDQLDNTTAGTTSVAALFNKSFALTFSGNANPSLNYPSSGYTTGSVLVTQSGNATALESGEFVTFTVSGTAADVPGFSLNLVDFSYGNRLANGQSSFGVEDTNGTVIEQLVPNTSTFGTISGSGISVASGQSMTFRPIANNAGGAGLSGFTFEVVPEPSHVALICGATFFFASRRWIKRRNG